MDPARVRSGFSVLLCAPPTTPTPRYRTSFKCQPAVSQSARKVSAGVSGCRILRCYTLLLLLLLLPNNDANDDGVTKEIVGIKYSTWKFRRLKLWQLHGFCIVGVLFLTFYLFIFFVQNCLANHYCHRRSQQTPLCCRKTEAFYNYNIQKNTKNPNLFYIFNFPALCKNRAGFQRCFFFL